MARKREKTQQQRQHADALADTVEGEVEMRVQQRPRRIRQQRNGRQRNHHQPEKPRECTHIEAAPGLPVEAPPA